MYYLIQQNLFKETHFYVLLDILKRHNMDYKIVRFVPFSNQILEEDSDEEVVLDRKDVFMFGSTTLTKAMKTMDLNPGVIYNQNHDMAVYAKAYGEHMLNSDGYVTEFGPVRKGTPYVFFARPTQDMKIFSGKLFTTDSWNEYLKECMDNNVFYDIQAKTQIFIASPKEIQKEIRCWVVDGKVVSISQYKIGARVIQQNYDHEQEAIDFAQRMVDIFAPSKAFVLDICLSENEYKVVEINCINCAGFYEVNMSKLIQSLENTFNEVEAV